MGSCVSAPRVVEGKNEESLQSPEESQTPQTALSSPRSQEPTKVEEAKVTPSSPVKLVSRKSQVEKLNQRLNKLPDIDLTDDNDVSEIPKPPMPSDDQGTEGGLKIISSPKEQLPQSEDANSHSSPYEEEVKSICSAIGTQSDSEALINEQIDFVTKIVKGEVTHDTDIPTVLYTLGLANPVCETLVNKYLIEGKWDTLLVSMCSAYLESRDSLSLEESDAIVLFSRRCVEFIEQCIRYRILEVTPHDDDSFPPNDAVSPADETAFGRTSAEPSELSGISGLPVLHDLQSLQALQGLQEINEIHDAQEFTDLAMNADMGDVYHPSTVSPQSSEDGNDIKDIKDIKDTSENSIPQDTKDTKDVEDTKDLKVTIDTKDTKDVEDTKDTKDTKDTEDIKDTTDSQDTKDTKDISDNHVLSTPTKSRDSQLSSSPVIDLSRHPLPDISSITFRSREFRSIKLILSAVAGLRTHFKENDLQFLTYPHDETPTLNETPSPLDDAETSQALKRWRQLMLVGTAISRLAGEEGVHDITDVNDLENEVRQFQPMEMNFTASLGITERARRKQEEVRAQTVWDEILNSMWLEDMWFQIVRSGTDSDVEKMEALLGKDPNAFYHDWDPRKLINCVDSQNRTALYLACLDCNLRVVRFLVARNADPRIAHMVDEKTEETPLECAVRWGYVEVVKILLEKEAYCKAEIKTISRLRKHCKNKEIEEILKKKYGELKDELK